MVAESRHELNEAEWTWLDELFATARSLVHELTGAAPVDGPPTLEDMDDALERWSQQPVRSRTHGNAVVSALGASLGAHLCLRLGLRWVVVSDEYGTELAVTGDPQELLVFPLNATAKRVSHGEDRFFAHFFAEVVRSADRLRGS